MKLSDRLKQKYNIVDIENIEDDVENIKVEKLDVLNPLVRKKEYEDIKHEVHKIIIEKYDNISQDNIRYTIERLVDEKAKNVPKVERARISQEIHDDIVGLGPLEPLLRNAQVTEIMVNDYDEIYIERRGLIEKTNVRFKDRDHVYRIIEKIVSPIGRRCDESNPMVDARLKGGSRVNIIIPPLSITGPTITIRKFNPTPFTVKDLVGFGSMSIQMASFLESCVRSKCNIMVSGGTGSGKTTLLNVLSSFIPENERIVTIEDSAELQLLQEHVVTLEARQSNAEGIGEISIRDLVRNSLRMRPDRIIVGEVRSGEALDMLQAMNTGHEGSIATAHANSPRDMVARLETMVMMAGMPLPVNAIRQQIASAIDIVIQQSRLSDGSRKITSISEVIGMEGDIVVLQDIFTFEITGYDENKNIIGSHNPIGIRPKILDKLYANDENVNLDWFKK